MTIEQIFPLTCRPPVAQALDAFNVFQSKEINLRTASIIISIYIVMASEIINDIYLELLSKTIKLI